MTDENHPDLPGLTRAASDIISVRRVFGEPYEQGGRLVVPVAKVLGWHAVAGAHGDARMGIRGGRGQGGHGPGGHGSDGHGPEGHGPEGDDAPRSHGGDGGPGADAGGAPGPDAPEGTGHGAHAGPAPTDAAETGAAQAGPGAPAGAVGSAGGNAGEGAGAGAGGGAGGGSGGRLHGAGRGPWPHGGPGHGPFDRAALGRSVLGRGPLWPFGAGRPGGRGVGSADAGSYATRVKPLGVFVIDDDGAQWQPALDLNRIILGGQVVGAVATVALAWALRRRRH